MNKKLNKEDVGICYVIVAITVCSFSYGGLVAQFQPIDPYAKNIWLAITVVCNLVAAFIASVGVRKIFK